MDEYLKIPLHPFSELLGGQSGPCVLVPKHLPTELILRVIAAVKSHQLGLKSMDYTYKMYNKNWRQHLKEAESGD